MIGWLSVLAVASVAFAGTAQARPAKVSSTHYGPGVTAPIAGFLTSLPHGPEIKRLLVYVAAPGEIATRCGPVMACYDPGAGRMVVSGESGEVAGIPREAVIAHEYGHHIAANRRRGVFPALAAGTPRWADAEGVCGLARSGQVFPGSQGLHYWENPGEAFAQAYSALVFPQLIEDWRYSPLLRPDALSLAMLRRDVARPWKPRRFTWRGRGASSRLVAPRIDGIVQARVTRGRRLILRAGGEVVARGRGVRYAACDSGPLTLTVKGSGVFRVRGVRP